MRRQMIGTVTLLCILATQFPGNSLADDANVGAIIELAKNAPSSPIPNKLYKWRVRPTVDLLFVSNLSSADKEAASQVVEEIRARCKCIAGVTAANSSEAVVLDNNNIILAVDSGGFSGIKEEYKSLFRWAYESDDEMSERLPSVVSDKGKIEFQFAADPHGPIKRTIAAVSSNNSAGALRSSIAIALLYSLSLSLTDPKKINAVTSKAMLETGKPTRSVNELGYLFLQSLYRNDVQPGIEPADFEKILRAE